MPSYEERPRKQILSRHTSSIASDKGSAFLGAGAALLRDISILFVPKDLVGSRRFAALWCHAIADKAPFTVPIEAFLRASCVTYNSMVLSSKGKTSGRLASDTNCLNASQARW